MVFLQYCVQELQDDGHELVIFMDANQNESQWYRPQNHNLKLKSEKAFNIDGAIDGSLKIFVQNTGLHTYHPQYKTWR
jgi:hypothetical protein